MPNHSKYDRGSLKIGNASVVTHDDGGWALPGGGRVESEEDAALAARRIHILIQQNGGYDPLGRPGKVRRGGAR